MEISLFLSFDIVEHIRSDQWSFVKCVFGSKHTIECTCTVLQTQMWFENVKTLLRVQYKLHTILIHVNCGNNRFNSTYTNPFKHSQCTRILDSCIFELDSKPVCPVHAIWICYDRNYWYKRFLLKLLYQFVRDCMHTWGPILFYWNNREQTFNEVRMWCSALRCIALWSVSRLKNKIAYKCITIRNNMNSNITTKIITNHTKFPYGLQSVSTNWSSI